MNFWQAIIKIVGYDSFYKGRNYPYRYVGEDRIEKSKDFYAHNFYVKSEHSSNRYNVKVINNGGNILGVSCDCPQFKKEKTCKHLAAVLIQNLDTIA